MSTRQAHIIAILVLGTLWACRREPDAIVAPLMVSKGVVVSERYEAEREGDCSSDLADHPRVMATGTVRVRGEPTRLFQIWKALSTRPAPRTWTPPFGVTAVSASGFRANSVMEQLVHITDEIPCCFLAWRSNGSDGCSFDGEVWFHPAAHSEESNHASTDVQLTLVCAQPESASSNESDVRRAMLEGRVRKQLHEFRTLVGS